MIKLKGVKKDYFIGERRINVLKSVDLEIKEGEFVILMGVSGSGKTTLLNIIGLLDRKTEGQYFFMGENVDDLSDQMLAKMRNRHIGFVFQQFFLLPYLNALENVLIPIVYSDKKIRNPRERAKELLEKFGLKDRIYSKPSQLSGGEQQRVAIARALINEPDLVLADEPTGALDSKTGSEIMELFRLLNEEGKTIICVTHDPNVKSFGKRVLKIVDGVISGGSEV